MSPGLLAVSDSSGHTKAHLSADDRGLSELALLYDQKVLAQLASGGILSATNPPKRDSAGLVLQDWSPDFKSRSFTAREDKTLGK
jgi:hypothetical protein